MKNRVLAGAFCLFLLAGLCACSREATAPPPTAAPPVGTPAPVAATEPPAAFTISLAGDCTLASSQFFRHYDAVVGGDLSWPFSGTADYFTQDDMSIVNLECSFSDDALYSASLFHFLGPAENAQMLRLGGIEFAGMGNNHTNDFGPRGMEDTRAALDAAGVAYAGPDGSAIFTTASGLAVGVYVAAWGADASQVADGVRALADGGDAELVIAMLHWGTEGSYQVNARQTEIAHAAIDAGADAVYGAHPHVLQPIEEYEGRYIFYSLGNFTFGGNTNPDDRDSVIIQLHAVHGEDGVTISGYTAIPCCLSGAPGVNDYRPVPYEPGTEEYARTLSKLDGSYSGPDLIYDRTQYQT